MPFGRRRATNIYGGKIAEDVAMLQGAQERAPGLAAGADVPRLIAEGLAFRTTLARVVHGEASRETIDKDALKVWWKQMQPYRERMMEAGTDADVAAALAASPAPAATTPAADPVEQLEKLHALHVAGGLTDAEFAAAKQRVLYGG